MLGTGLVPTAGQGQHLEPGVDIRHGAGWTDGNTQEVKMPIVNDDGTISSKSIDELLEELFNDAKGG